MRFLAWTLILNQHNKNNSKVNNKVSNKIRVNKVSNNPKFQTKSHK